MKKSEIPWASVEDLTVEIRSGSLSPVELVEVALERARGVGTEINAFVTVTEEDAREAARRAEEEIEEGGWRGPLHGVPVSVKDLVHVRGVRTTAGSKAFDHVPDADATSVKRIRQTGGIVIGKTNLHELAFGVTTENPHFGACRNPWDAESITGGSSGGSAAAVAAGVGQVSVGTDTGGSVRIPASCCGVVGLKPTYGRVSRHGVVPLAWSLDHLGVLGRRVWDVAAVMDAFSGRDLRDPTSSVEGVPSHVEAAEKVPSDFKVGVVEEYFFDLLSREVEDSFWKAVDTLRDLGGEVVDLEYPYLEHVSAARTVATFAEAASEHRSRLRERPHGIGREVRTNLEVGMRMPAGRYVDSLRAMTHLRQEFLETTKEVDVVATPTLPVQAPRIGEGSVSVDGEDVAVRTALLRLTEAFNVFGTPAASLPSGFSTDELPLGLQLTGKPFGEAFLLSVAGAYEEKQEFYRRRPSL